MKFINFHNFFICFIYIFRYLTTNEFLTFVYFIINLIYIVQIIFD